MSNSARVPKVAAPSAQSSPPGAAAQFLERALENGPRPAAEIAQAAEKAGVAPSALKQARADLGVLAEKRGFGADGEWLLSLGAIGAAAGPGGGSPLGWGLLAAAAASFGIAYLCIEANRAAAENGGCPAPGTAGLPAPPDAERRDCCPRWFIVLLTLAGVVLAILGLGKL
jgi:hypothetical protein